MGLDWLENWQEKTGAAGNAPEPELKPEVMASLFGNVPLREQ